MKPITKYQTKDGREFNDEVAAEDHEALLDLIESAVAPLGHLPQDDECSANHESDMFEGLDRDAFALAKEHEHFETERDTMEAQEKLKLELTEWRKGPWVRKEDHDELVDRLKASEANNTLIRSAIAIFRDAKGRYNTQLAADRLFRLADKREGVVS